MIFHWILCTILFSTVIATTPPIEEKVIEKNITEATTAPENTETETEKTSKDIEPTKKTVCKLDFSCLQEDDLENPKVDDVKLYDASNHHDNTKISFTPGSYERMAYGSKVHADQNAGANNARNRQLESMNRHHIPD